MDREQPTQLSSRSENRSLRGGTVITIGMIADQEFLPSSGRTAIRQIPLHRSAVDRSSQALSFQRSAAKRSLVLQHRSFREKSGFLFLVTSTLDDW
jgi:hypothetical protein